MSRPVQVNLGGRTFSLRTDDPEDHVHACAALVTERIEELRAKGAPEAAVGLFVAMTIADELLKLRASNADSGDALRNHLNALRKAVG